MTFTALLAQLKPLLEKATLRPWIRVGTAFSGVMSANAAGCRIDKLIGAPGGGK